MVARVRSESDHTHTHTHTMASFYAPCFELGHMHLAGRDNFE